MSLIDYVAFAPFLGSMPIGNQIWEECPSHKKRRGFHHGLSRTINEPFQCIADPFFKAFALRYTYRVWL